MNKRQKQSMVEAADWLVRQQERLLTDKEKTQFDQWQQACKYNQIAWQRAQQFISRVDTLPKDIAYAVLNRPDDEKRRLAIGKLALLFAVGPFIWGTYKTVTTQQWTADYRTAKGETKQVTLPDGTVVKLNTASAFDIFFDENVRLFLLREGEIEIRTKATAYKDLKPFMVKTQDAILSPLDASFTVRQYNTLTRIGVIEGDVPATPRLTENNNYLIPAGQQADLSSYELLSQQPLRSETTSWLDSMLAADNMPLSTFIQEVSRYHSSLLRVSPDIQTLRISGAYPTRDLDTILNMLSRTYPIHVKRHLGSYWVTIEAA